MYKTLNFSRIDKGRAPFPLMITIEQRRETCQKEHCFLKKSIGNTVMDVILFICQSCPWSIKITTNGIAFRPIKRDVYV